MSKFIKINKGFTPEANFWEMNPQLIYMTPFSKLYKRDKSKNKMNSSSEMWCIFFMCDPDEEENLFYRIGIEERKRMLKDTYFPKIKWGEKLLVECMEMYPISCLSAIERAYTEEKESIKNRTDFMRKYEKKITDIDLLSLEKEHFNQVVKIRGLLETMRKNTQAIYKQLEQVEEKFMKNKSSIRIKGGRRQSKTEKKLL